MSRPRDLRTAPAFGALIAIAVSGSAAARLPPILQTGSGPVTLPNLAYNGGRVIQNLKVQAVFWTAPPATTPQASIDKFYSDYLVSPAYTWLSEYGTTTGGPDGGPQTVNPGTYLPSVVITPAGTGSTIQTAQLVAELQADIQNGKLAAPDGDTLYVVHLGPGIVMSDPGSVSCLQWCGFHNSFQVGTLKVIYAVIGDYSQSSQCTVGCGEALNPLDNLTSTVSHEVAEAVTDPDVGTAARETGCGPGWCDAAPPDSASSHAEIGDICDFPPVTQGSFTGPNGTHTVQRLWSNAHSGCITTVPEAIGLTMTPANTYLAQPGTADYNLSVVPPANGTSPITLLNIFALPTGLTAVFDNQRLQPGQSTLLHITAGATAPADWRFAVNASSGNTEAYAVAGIGFDDFSASGPTGVSLRAGGTANLTITTQLTKGTGPMALTAQLQNPPPGVSASFSPSSFNAGDTISVTLSAASGTASGTDVLTFGLSGTRRSVSVQTTANIDGDDFSASLGSSSVTVDRTKSAIVPITTSTAHGNNQALTLTVDGLPNGVTGTFDSSSITSGGNANLNLTAAADADLGAGSFTVHVTGAVGTVLDLPGTVTVNPAPGCGCGPSGAGLALPALLLAGLVTWRPRRAPRPRQREREG